MHSLGVKPLTSVLLAGCFAACNRNELSLQSEESAVLFMPLRQILTLKSDCRWECCSYLAKSQSPAKLLQGYCITLGYANYHTLAHYRWSNNRVSVVSFVAISSHTHIQTHTHTDSHSWNAQTQALLLPELPWLLQCMFEVSIALVPCCFSPRLSLSSSTLVCKVVSWRSEEFYADVTETTEVSDLLELWSFSWCFLYRCLGVYSMLWT